MHQFGLGVDAVLTCVFGGLLEQIRRFLLPTVEELVVPDGRLGYQHHVHGIENVDDDDLRIVELGRRNRERSSGVFGTVHRHENFCAITVSTTVIYKSVSLDLSSHKLEMRDHCLETGVETEGIGTALFRAVQ